MKTYMAYVEITNSGHNPIKKYFVSCAESIFGFKFDVQQRVKEITGQNSSVEIIYTAELGDHCILGDIL